ncbi:Serine/threonine-protein kinase MPS1 [Spathaspora sp. JA1]|nr:Serine/threonine-protein kinase MPS1 [Spathaspora sp. JA1]
MSFDSIRMNHTPPSTFLKRELSNEQQQMTSTEIVTGIYKYDFRENKRSATLRNKLATQMGNSVDTRTEDGSFSSCSSNNSTGVSSKATTIPNTIASNITRKRKGRCFGLSLGPAMRASMKEEEQVEEEKYEQDYNQDYKEEYKQEYKQDYKQEYSDRMSEIEEAVKERSKTFKFEEVVSPSAKNLQQQRKVMFPNMLESIENKENQEEVLFKKIEDSSRPALAEIPINIETAFRKPKLPKSIHPAVTPKPFRSQVSTPPPPPVQAVPAAQDTPHITTRRPTSAPIAHPRRIIINDQHYEKLELLGRGGSSKVYRVKSLSNNQIYAMKKVSTGHSDETFLAGFKGEIDLLLKLRHSDRVVKLIDHAITEGSIYLVMERGEIDFAQVLNNKLRSKNPFDLDFIRFHSLEMLQCIAAVHDSDIVHSDLKPANFLFVKGVLKIIDFGIANAVPEHTINIYRESQIGTPNYMAPEALTEVNHAIMPRSTWKVGKPSDIWSIGCIVYQLIYGRPPYDHYSGLNKRMAIADPRIKIEYPNTGIGGGRVPETAIELMQMCLKREPRERWTVEECLNCEFLHPKIVTSKLLQEIVHQIMDYGHNRRINNDSIGIDEYDDMVELVMEKISNLNYR